ncbi:hypothetical protein KJY77_02625 [Canibacter sp. lx-72]|uniref:hypothetical protein n=1 Tax=Canibacter zhuwentaonis TaxID=2837491 RepID=UPI001BDCF5AE|nr:hypothetical protein [Canibacter zhuwentaonis]MBT1018037.1 hypothetical protein [Canibacter zhuwentaonis]MBT1035428.1 hypothetical protein [Canibacter zhuwentaonis]
MTPQQRNSTAKEARRVKRRADFEGELQEAESVTTTLQEITAESSRRGSSAADARSAVDSAAERLLREKPPHWA